MMTRLLTLAGALLLLSAAPAHALTFKVTKTADTNDGVCNADCSLREAVTTANAPPTATADIVDLSNGGTYELTLGALPSVTDPLTLDGAGADSTVIAQRGNFRVLNASTTLTVREVTVTGGNEPGNGGGILKSGAGTLQILDSSVSGNRAAAPGSVNSGGGGIHVSGNGNVIISHSTVSGNSSGPQGSTGDNNGGGGIHHQSTGSLSITNSTIDGNTATVTTGNQNGGGGVWTSTGVAILSNSTISSNRVNASGVAISRGGGVFNANASGVSLTHTILAANIATTGHNCSGVFASAGNNLEHPGGSCNLVDPSDLPPSDPMLGPLENNGGGTPTRELRPGSPAINAGDQTGNCESDDQRGVARPRGDECDLGAYEFDGLTVASIPNCSPTGSIPLTMTPAPGEGVEDFRYKIDGGPEQVADVPDAFAPASTTIEVPEGRRQLEYWGEFSNGSELGHHRPPVLVDKTRPSVDVQGGQRSTTYVIRRRATINVQAADALSGLVDNPSGAQRVSTTSRGRKEVQRTATDLCGNQASDSFAYRVLGPGLGVRAVIEVVSGRVRFGRRAASSAGAAQKGQSFSALRAPREVPIGTFLDTRRGRARITSSSTTGTRIQDGQFSAGVFQVLQSRKRSARGLTELRLKGSSFSSCRSARSGKRATAAASIRRRLRANARGRFRTRGRHSAATVRGTIWVTADRCDGTLTTVTRGRVAVRDFRRKKTVLVRAGKRYLARAAR